MKLERRRDRVTASLTGELDHCRAHSIRRELDDMIADPAVRQLVLDMADMTFMDSSGIGVILGRYRILAPRGGKVLVRNMNEHVKRIFLLSGMNQIIEML